MDSHLKITAKGAAGQYVTPVVKVKEDCVGWRKINQEFVTSAILFSLITTLVNCITKKYKIKSKNF